MGDQVRPRRSDANGDGSAVTEETSLLDRQKHTVKQASYREALRDCIIGFADGLTVPFALMAGLSTYVHVLQSRHYAAAHALALMPLPSSC